MSSFTCYSLSIKRGMLPKADEATAPLQHLAVVEANTDVALQASMALPWDYGQLCIANLS